MGNCLCKFHRPVGIDTSEALILVVGNDSERKSRFARDLAEARGATANYENMAGVRFFTRKPSPHEAPVTVVMDTAPLRTTEDLPRVDNARVWVSQNSLRKLYGQVVFVVCFIDPTDEIYEEPNFEHNKFSWLHVLGSVFEHKKKEIMILVNSVEKVTDEATRLRLSNVLRRDGFRCQENIIFVSPSKGGGYDDTPILKRVLQCSVLRGCCADDDEKAIVNPEAAMCPFRLPKVDWHNRDKDKFGPWGPENVILFGMSGSGKSTLANMLTSGTLDGVDAIFSTSSGLRGETKTVMKGQGRGWRVIDTPGLGEPNKDLRSGVSTDRAAKLIREYVMLVQGVYCHFMYVWKIGRVQLSDTVLWDIFNKMFNGEGIGKHMTIVVSGADQAWLDENIERLKECFVGCDSFITADFPAKDPDGDEETEHENQDIRLESLKELEDYLASLCRLDSSCKLGMWSLGTQRSVIARGDDSPFTMGAHMRQNQPFGPSAGTPQPSDYETARAYIRIKSITTKTCLPGRRLDVVPSRNRRIGPAH
ncbi:unnamed protein product [Calypogeia fissa]